MLVMTLLVRNEQDILESNIIYHLEQGVDFIIATDNLSTDGTPDILHKYETRGVLHVINETGDDYSQYRWVTRMARMAAIQYKAHWVINNDADEFWWPGTSGTLADYLNSQPEKTKVLSVQRHNFAPLASSGINMPFYKAMVYRESLSLNTLGEPLQPKVCHRSHPDIEVRQGNHAVMLDNKIMDAEPSSLSILHFPIRSLDQFRQKIVLGGAAYARNTHLNKGMGKTWRVLHELLESGDFDSFYKTQEYDSKRIEEGLSDGRLILDNRLKNFMEKITHNNN